MTSWDEAHNDTDAFIARLHGLSTVLREVTMEWPGLCNPDPLANGILMMIVTMNEDLERLTKLREIEWQAKLSAQKAA